jgi:hypothetical protein
LHNFPLAPLTNLSSNIVVLTERNNFFRFIAVIPGKMAQKKSGFPDFLFQMVAQGRVELPTPAFSVLCSAS